MLVRQPHVCPWGCCFAFDNPLRRLVHDPAAILSPHVREGFTVVDIGPGMGYFTVELCRLVGKTGKVIAVDLQEEMLSSVRWRVQKAGFGDRLEVRVTGPEKLDVSEKADFILAFWMVHEVPDRGRFMGEITALLKPQGSFLLVEPYLHVSASAFHDTVRKGEAAGLVQKATPKIAFGRSVLFSL
jgi:ubiquinone/menaquinone biosynthesis C-methylase UbiE